METYIINSVEVEYDTFDLANMEVFRDESKRVAALSELSANVTEDNYIEIIREMCEGVMDAFDTIIGEGTSDLVFGGKVNAKTVPAAWKQFTQDVAAVMNEANPAPAMNREQRRAAERASRREAAKKRVEARQNEA